VRSETELQLLEEEHAEQCGRLVRGLGWLAFAIGVCLACNGLGGWPLALIVGVPASFAAVVIGLTWTLEGAVRALLSAHDIRQLRQLPVARAIRGRCRRTAC
jgi:hypothetical protein